MSHHYVLLIKLLLLQDPEEDDPFYYGTSVQLVEYWTELGNYAEADYGHGSHCTVHSFVRDFFEEQIVIVGLVLSSPCKCWMVYASLSIMSV